MTDTPKPLRVLFCGAVLQNFFDLPAAEIGKVWNATGEMLRGIRDLPACPCWARWTMTRRWWAPRPMAGPGPSTSWPMCPTAPTVVAACNLFRTINVGEHRLWKYMRVEARIGRELVIPA
jgi:hypothetical protein